MYRLTFAVALTGTLLLSGCDKITPQDNRADHISKVRTLHLETNDCPAGVSKALQAQGFAIMQEDQAADALLKVTINRTGRNLDKLPEFGGFGAKANFNVQVLGKDDKVLFTTAGEEGSLTSKEMCEDIGDEIGEKLRGSPLGTVN